MKEEIKEILELLRDGVKRPVVTLSKYSLDNICELNSNECKQLLEYIENLQSQLKVKEEAVEKFEKYLNNCVNELENNYVTSSIQNTINTGIVDITKVILSKYKEILSKGENK